MNKTHFAMKRYRDSIEAKKQIQFKKMLKRIGLKKPKNNQIEKHLKKV